MTLPIPSNRVSRLKKWTLALATTATLMTAGLKPGGAGLLKKNEEQAGASSRSFSDPRAEEIYEKIHLGHEISSLTSEDDAACALVLSKLFPEPMLPEDLSDIRSVQALLLAQGELNKAIEDATRELASRFSQVTLDGLNELSAQKSSLDRKIYWGNTRTTFGVADASSLAQKLWEAGLVSSWHWAVTNFGIPLAVPGSDILSKITEDQNDVFNNIVRNIVDDIFFDGLTKTYQKFSMVGQGNDNWRTAKNSSRQAIDSLLCYFGVPFWNLTTDDKRKNNQGTPVDFATKNGLVKSLAFLDKNTVEQVGYCGENFAFGQLGVCKGWVAGRVAFVILRKLNEEDKVRLVGFKADLSGTAQESEKDFARILSLYGKNIYTQTLELAVNIHNKIPEN